MSNWTHVAGVVRIDDLRLSDETPDFDKMFGKEVRYEDSLDVWEDADENPDDYLPMGREGSLRKSVWINPDNSSISAYTVSIFGDLRDHDDPQAIVDWFEKKLKNVWVRQAMITVSNECNGEVSWVWEYKEEDDDGNNESED